MEAKKKQIFTRCLIGSMIVHLALFYTGAVKNTQNRINFSKNVSHRTNVKLVINQKPVKKVVKKRIVKTKKVASKKKQVLHKKTSPIKEIKAERAFKANNIITGQNSKLAAYLKEVRQVIIDNKKYPRIAKKLRQQGEVQVLVELSWPNVLSKVELVKKSEHDILYKSALDSITELEDIPQMPNVLKEEFLTKRLQFRVPMSFELL